MEISASVEVPTQNGKYNTSKKQLLNEFSDIQQEDFSIELGRKGELEFGTVQNIQVFFKGELIIDTDNNVKNHKTPRICLAINYEDTPKRIATNDKNDIRYIGKNQGYVGNVYLPDKYKGKGLAKFIYQGIANKLGIEIVRGDTISSDSQNARKKRANTPFIPQ